MQINRFRTLAFGALLGMGLLGESIGAARVRENQEATLENLNRARSGEANASYKYQLFAEQAEKEGFHQVAKLFRAVSFAEATHRNNHEAVILALGGSPSLVKLEDPEVLTTGENLRNPLEGEAYEKNEMYPEFIREAENAGIPGAVRTFTDARNAEAQHAELFQDALDNLGHERAKDYCVSRLTGATLSIPIAADCPPEQVTVRAFTRIE